MNDPWAHWYKQQRYAVRKYDSTPPEPMPQHRRIDTVIAVLGYVGLLGLIVWGLV